MQLKLPCWNGVKAGFFFPKRPASSMFIVFNSDTSSSVSSVLVAQSVGTYLNKYTNPQINELIATLKKKKRTFSLTKNLYYYIRLNCTNPAAKKEGNSRHLRLG